MDDEWKRYPFRITPLDLIEYERRNRELFPTTYLTSIGIIQSVALGIIVYKLFSGSELYPLRFAWPAAWCWALELSSIGVGIAAALVITMEYCWYVLVVRYTTAFFDTVVPIGLGLFEFAPLFFVNEFQYGYWFLSNAFFAVWGVLAYAHSYYRCREDYFSPADAKIHSLTQANIRTSFVPIAAISLSDFLSYLTFPHLGFAPLIAVNLASIAALVWIMWKSHRFLEKVENHFGRQQEERRKKKSPAEEQNEPDDRKDS